MQRAPLAAFLVIAIAGCKSVGLSSPPTETGCAAHGLAEVLEKPGYLLDGELGNTDIRVGRLPDTGNGLATLIHFDRRFVESGQITTLPRVRLSVGDWGQRACTVVMSEAECPESVDVYRRLASRSLPVGFLFEHPSDETLMHGTSYYLQSLDGNGNEMKWSYYGHPAHPFQAEIDSAIDALSRCLSFAEAAYSRAPSN